MTNLKLFIKSLSVAMVITIILSLLPFQSNCKNISNEVFRLHILANSNSKADQSLKLKVRDEVLKYTKALYKSSNSLNQAENLTASNLQSIANVAKNTVNKYGYNYSVKAEIKKMYFSTRYYGKVTMPAGFYDALRITIGKGQGHNWWCVMYPSLCVGTSTDYSSLKDKTSNDEYNLLTNEKYEYKFYVVEIFEKIISFFNS